MAAWTEGLSHEEIVDIENFLAESESLELLRNRRPGDDSARHRTLPVPRDHVGSPGDWDKHARRRDKDLDVCVGFRFWDRPLTLAESQSERTSGQHSYRTRVRFEKRTDHGMRYPESSSIGPLDLWPGMGQRATDILEAIEAAEEAEVISLDEMRADELGEAA